VHLDDPVHLTEYGDARAAEAMVCLHGLGGSALNFGLVAPALAEGRRVLVPDLLGHGRSSAPVGSEPAVEAQLQMLERMVDREVGAPIVLVGHSMGGILALLLAGRAPEKVARLVLLDPPVPNVTRFDRDPRLSAKLAMLRLPGMGALVCRQVMGMTPEQLAARQLSDATPHADRIPRDAVDATISEIRAVRSTGDGGRSGQRSQFRAILDVVALLARPADWGRSLGAIDAPTLWLHGEDDPLASVHGARALVASRPDWAFVSRPGVGHLPHLEDADWTARTIGDWLRDGTLQR
jgi:pimeloyl-ACP methyl ester carboxylesterase